MLMGRYTYNEIAARIHRKMVDSGRSRKELYSELRIDKGLFSRKLRHDASSFTYDEISKIAEYFDAPPGWPFIEETLAKSIQLAEMTLKVLSERRPIPPPSASPAPAATGRRRAAAGT